MILRNPQVLRELTKPRSNRVLSVAQLAKKADVSKGFIYQLLNETSGTDPKVAARIAKAAGMRRDALFMPSPGEQVGSEND